MFAPLALFLAIVLAAAAAHKLIAQERLATAAARLTGLSQPMGHVVSFGAGAIEILAAIALAIPATRISGALIAAGLWLAYGVALVGAYRSGLSLDCGCSFAGKPKPVDRFAFVRVFGLALIAICVALFPPGAVGVESLFAALALFSLYHAASEIAALPSPFWSVAR